MSIFNEQCIGGEDHWMSSAFIRMYFLSRRPQQKQTTWRKSLAHPSKNSSPYDYMSFWYNKTYSSTIHLDFQLYISSSIIYSTQHILGGRRSRTKRHMKCTAESCLSVWKDDDPATEGCCVNWARYSWTMESFS